MNDPKMNSNKDVNKAAGQQGGQGYNPNAPKAPQQGNKPYQPNQNPKANQQKGGHADAGMKDGNKSGGWDSNKGGSGNF